MSFELLGRVHKELSITGSALYETILAVAERVNRKVQIIRLHWHAATLLERMDRVTGDVGREIADHVARRFLVRGPLDTGFGSLDHLLTRAMGRVRDLKQSLVQIDTQIRELKLEAIHQDLLRLQQDLALRGAGIERILIPRGAPAVGQPARACPRPLSVHMASVLRGPFLLSPGDDLVFRPEDIVVLIGLQAELDQVTSWFTGSTIMSRTTMSRTTSRPAATGGTQ